MKTVLCLICIFSVTGLLGQPTQLYPDRHTTNATDGWISCEKSANPNPAHGQSHWIHYDFGSSYDLHDMTIWNMNHPDFIQDGLKNVIIEYSSNGTTWTLVDTVTFPKANASGFYEGFVGPDMQGISARHLLLTPIDNHGGGCYALSEIRVFTEDQTQPEFNLAMAPCENDRLYKNISSGLELGGSFNGPGVTDNGNETFNFDPDVVGPGTYPITYSYGGGDMIAEITVLPCGVHPCQPCLDCIVSDTLAVDDDPIVSNTYKAFMVTSEGKVHPGSNVEFHGNEAVKLLPGFEVMSSGLFSIDFRLCDMNPVLNSSFENDDSDWEFSVNSAAEANLAFETGNPYQGSKSARVDVTGISGTTWHIQLYQVGHTIEDGKTYRLTFAGRAEGGKPIQVIWQHDGSPWTVYESESFYLTDNWEVYSFVFESEDTVLNDVRISFQLGAETGSYFLDIVKFVEE